MNFEWEQLDDGVFRCRLPFLDVTIGLVWGGTGALLIDTGTTLTEGRALRADAQALSGRDVSHILLTHNDFDHILGASAFAAAVYCAPPVATTMTREATALRADALRHGADPGEVDAALAALRPPQHEVWAADIDLGGRTVAIRHPGRGHTDHDLIAIVAGTEVRVVFCGDLVEESGDPVVQTGSDAAAWPATLTRLLEAGGDDARYVPGHGAVVDAEFVRRQQQWLRRL
ncbi:MBL fold metallo-hydrolase [Mycolicibacterium sp. XJ1819]